MTTSESGPGELSRQETPALAAVVRRAPGDLGIDLDALSPLLEATGPLAVVDLETTGLTEDARSRIIEIGIVTLDPGASDLGVFSSLVACEQPLPLVVQRLTGLRDEDLAAAPHISRVAVVAAELLAGRAIVAHNTGFERHFLAREISSELAASRYLDTLDLLALTHPDTPDLRLESFARELLGKEEQHRALDDALDALRVVSAVGVGASAGERRYRVAHRALERFVPDAPWLPLLGGGTAAGPAGFEAALDELEEEREGVDPFEYIEIGPSDEKPVPFDEEAIAAALADVERGRRHLPGYRVREEQIELARRFTRTLASGGTLLLEGGTGVGKSFAYLAAAIPFALDPERPGRKARHEPVVVSTRTKLLQDQLLLKDIAAAARFLGYPQLRALSIKGRANYVCERRLSDALAEASDTSLLAEDRHAYAVLLACARTRPHGEVGTLPGALFARHPLLRDLRRRSVARRAEQCSREQCARQPGCPFGRRRASLAKADLVVANHDLLLRWPPDYPSFSDVVIDEGHELAGVADEVYAQSVRPLDLLERVDELFPKPRLGTRSGPTGPAATVGTGRAAGWRRDLRLDLTSLGRALSLAAGEYGELQLPPMAGELHPDAAAIAESAAQRLLEIAGTAERRATSGDEERAQEIERAAGELREAAHLLRLAFRSEQDDFVATFEDLVHPYDRWSLFLRAVSPAEPFHEGFAARLDSLAVLSASLFVDGDAFAALGTLELEERQRDLDRISVQSPFPYADHMRVVALDGVDDLVEETALVLARVARSLGGRTLGLFTSLRRMNEVAQRLSQLLRGEGIDVLTPRRATDDPGALVQRFARARGGAVLLGARTFWQGLDIPGDALQAVVIEKLPFEVPTELRRRRESRIRAEGLDPFERSALGHMLLHLKQMTGRLIRTEEDRGLVVIVDGRPRRGYFEAVEQALPPGVAVRVLGAEEAEERLPEVLGEIGLGRTEGPTGS